MRGLRRFEQRTLERPENPGIKHQKPRTRQHIIHPQFAGALPGHGIGRAVFTARLRVLQARVGQEGGERLFAAFAINRVSVEISQQHHRAIGQRRGNAAIIGEGFAIQIADQKVDLGLVAQAVSIFIPVKNRRGRVGGKQAQRAAWQGDLDIPQAMGCQAELLPDGIGVKGRAIRGQRCGAEIAPFEPVELPRTGNRIAREQHHALRPFKTPETPIIVPIPQAAIAGDIQPRIQPGIAQRRIEIRVFQPRQGVKRAQGKVLVIIVKPGEQQDIGAKGGDDFRPRQNILIPVDYILEQQPRPIAAQPDIIAG